MTDASLVVSEVFGPTVQGEGPSAGAPAMFVRLGGCNLACRWCDTAYTWDWTGVSDMAVDRGAPFRARDELTRMAWRDVYAQVIAAGDRGVRLLVVTGGEPLQQQRRLQPFVREVLAAGWTVEVETNGTISPDLDGVRWNVSPKLAHSGDPADRRLHVDVLRAFADRDAAFKFVAGTPGHLAEIDSMCQQAGIPERLVWVMPLGATAEQVTKSTAAIADAVVAYGWRLSTRLHVYAWGGERGR